MSLTLVQSAAQPAHTSAQQTSSTSMTPAQAATDRAKLLSMAADHVMAANRITDVNDLRYFDMRDLNEVRINLYLALELLAVANRQNQ